MTIADQPRVLSLCTGYGGLTRAVETVTGGRTMRMLGNGVVEQQAVAALQHLATVAHEVA